MALPLRPPAQHDFPRGLESNSSTRLNSLVILLYKRLRGLQDGSWNLLFAQIVM
jgi:hypothetical protein